MGVRARVESARMGESDEVPLEVDLLLLQLLKSVKRMRLSRAARKQAFVRRCAMSKV